jgi:shikimate kinase
MTKADDLKPAPAIIFIGLMGAGKSCIGRRLAGRFGLPFVDADQEIEKAAGCSIQEIFDEHGEAAFRSGERRVIARLLDEPGRKVLATGGGAFMNPKIRAEIKRNGISVWLRADLDLLHKRTSRRDTRPLLKTGNPREILARLMEERYPVYETADIVIDSFDGPPEITVDRVVAALKDYGVALERA